ncbi:MAG TPA: hypothetical protein VFV01_47925 [Spirillospora sp.]|nr:hypothetical protein [Spirillospora sp.]
MKQPETPEGGRFDSGLGHNSARNFCGAQIERREHMQVLAQRLRKGDYLSGYGVEVTDTPAVEGGTVVVPVTDGWPMKFGFDFDEAVEVERRAAS